MRFYAYGMMGRLLLWGGWVLFSVSPAFAEATLSKSDFKVAGRVRQLETMRWQGKQYLSAQIQAAKEHGSGRSLILLEFNGKALRQTGPWPLPAGVEFVQPLGAIGAAPAWLAFGQQGWGILLLRSGQLSFTGCDCPTAYSPRFRPSLTRDRFVFDLDGKGLPEVLLPEKSALVAYRISKPPPLLEAWWRLPWNGQSAPLKPQKKRPKRFIIPRFLTGRIGESNLREVFILNNAFVWVAGLAGMTGKPGVPSPYQSPLPGLPDLAKKSIRYVNELLDMDHDGIPDALHVTLLNNGDLFNQKNQLRWYPGRLTEGQLRFAPSPKVLTGDAGALAKVLQTRGGTAPEWALLIARSEVSMANLLQTLASRKLRLDFTIHRLKAGALLDAEPGGSLLLEGFGQSGARPFLLALDMTGDGRRELLVNTRPNLLRVVSTSGADWFSKRFLAETEVEMPSTKDTVLQTDLDDDGRAELAIWHRKGNTAQRGRISVIWLP